MGIKKRQFTKNVLPKVITITMISSFIYIGQNLETSYALSDENAISQPYTVSNNQNGKIKECDYLNIRSGASVKYPVVGKGYTNETVDILDKDNGWYKVKISNGVVGWANGSYISIEGTNQNVSKADKVINVAKNQLGKPYKWGAGGPNAFDCSGLTSYAYKNGANVSLPRSSREQARVGKSVSKGELKPGDLVFFASSGNGINHVGLYIGDSKMIHSPKPGETVRVDKINSGYYSKTYVSAKRIL